MKKWFNLTPSGNGKAEIFIYDEIGSDWYAPDGVTAKQFIDAVQSLGNVTDITLRINSPGGDVFGSLAIYNFLRQHPARITVRIDGLAGSSASVIAMVGDQIVMPSNAHLFIHNPLAIIGAADAESLRKTVEELDKTANSIAGIYRDRTGLPEDEIRAIMDASTYLSAEEAVAKGFADQIDEPVRIAATQRPEVAAAVAATEFKFHATIQARDEEIRRLADELAKVQPQKIEANEVIRLCASAGIGTMLASRWIESDLPAEQINSHIGLAQKIQDICAAAHISPAPYIECCDDPAKAIGRALTERLARESDEKGIDNTLMQPSSDSGWSQVFTKASRGCFSGNHK